MAVVRLARENRLFLTKSECHTLCTITIWWMKYKILDRDKHLAWRTKKYKCSKKQNSIIQYCRFSLSHHHQNHSTSNVKNHRGKRRWMFKQGRKDSGLRDVSCGRYSKKCFTQIYKAMYGDAMFVSLWGTQIWRPEANKNICHRVLYKEPVVVFWELINIYMRIYFHCKDCSDCEISAHKLLFLVYITAFSATILIISCHAKA